MKIKHLISSFLLACAMAVGVCVFVNINDKSKSESVSAAAPSTFFVDVGGINNFGGFSGKTYSDFDYYAHSWGGNGDADDLGTLVTGTDALYKFTNTNSNTNLLILIVKKGAGVVWNGDNFLVQTGDFSFADDSNTYVLASNSGYVWYSYADNRQEVADGAYLRGCYHGVEDWSSNASLGSDEYVSYDYSQSKFSSKLELYAGDFFKFVRFDEGKDYWRTISSIESADDTYFPKAWEGNNVKVLNAGIYYVSAGESEGYEWYYVDNSASAFAYEFLNSMTCDETGASEPEFVSGKSWSYFADWYSHNLDSYAKTVFYQTAASNDNGTNIEKCISRYFTIMANHGTTKYPPFMTNAAGNAYRSGLSVSMPILFRTTNTNSIAVVVIVTMVSLTAIGGYFFIRKRKEN